MKIHLVLLGLVAFSSLASAQVKVSDTGSGRSIDLKSASIIYDSDDWTVVGKAAAMLSEDIGRVTGRDAEMRTSLPSSQAVIVGTVGHSRWIDRLVSERKIDVSAITGDGERYIIKNLKNPFPGVSRAVIVAGSDRRGTAYGILSISEAIGVSPWYWWADVPAAHRDRLFVDADFVSSAPSVKYRGIFINDEDWGLKPWASDNYEKDLGDIGPRTYARVCELLLRLKGNMLAPAMHSCTGAFYTHPQSKEIADSYAIMITTSHCEPLLFNNASLLEWDTRRDGEWNYKLNRQTIVNKLDSRVKEASPYENIYTLALRGLHDQGMRGDLTDKEKVEMLTLAISDQRNILSKYIKKPLESIPQIFVPYKEALDVYELGLKVPDDATLVWVDDNYGYMKRLSNPEEQKRPGHSGVYYHVSYLGPPHDYLWLCTTPPALMYEELKKAYDTGADRYWLLNVGDIKPAELAISTFFSMAWNLSDFSYDNINRSQAEYASRLFGASYQARLQSILDDYYRLAWSRKPEFMGWEREWDAPGTGEIKDTEFSFENYSEASTRLADYKSLSDRAESLLNELPESSRAAFFEMIAYPSEASFQMNRKFLMAQLNHELLKKGDIAHANWAAEQARSAFDSINVLIGKYNSMLDGKWNGMMKLSPGYCARYQNMPEVTFTQGVNPAAVDLSPDPEADRLEGCTVIDLASYTGRKTDRGHSLRLIRGLGYDWQSIQFGEASEAAVDPAGRNAPRFEYRFGRVAADSVNVTVYSLPVFPLFKGRGTRFGVSVDGSSTAVAENIQKEFSTGWKDQVLRNSAIFTTSFRVDSSLREHHLTLSCGDPGMIIQKVVIDWGGLKKTYAGPRAGDAIH